MSKNADSQLIKVQIAIAELRAFCLKHSAAYKNGIGPRPIAKQITKIITQTILKYEKAIFLCFFIKINHLVLSGLKKLNELIFFI